MAVLTEVELIDGAASRHGKIAEEISAHVCLNDCVNLRTCVMFRSGRRTPGLGTVSSGENSMKRGQARAPFRRWRSTTAAKRLCCSATNTTARRSAIPENGTARSGSKRQPEAHPRGMPMCSPTTGDAASGVVQQHGWQRQTSVRRHLGMERPALAQDQCYGNRQTERR